MLRFCGLRESLSKFRASHFAHRATQMICTSMYFPRVDIPTACRKTDRFDESVCRHAVMTSSSQPKVFLAKALQRYRQLIQKEGDL